MSRPLTGVLADKSYSYRALEKMTAYVRQELKLSPDGAIDPHGWREWGQVEPG